MYVLLKNYTTAQIYRNLNLMKSSTNRTSPLETKWVYHYKQKYKTLKYTPDNNIEADTLLRPLEYAEYLEYQSMGF